MTEPSSDGAGDAGPERGTRQALLDALAAADGPVSGPALAADLGVSRAAVWKQVERLRAAGFGIESGPDGYRVTDVPEYGEAAIEFGLAAPYDVEYHETLASTNDRARELARAGAGEVAVVADEQTGGRGRLDRAWASPSGGVWVSLLVRPDRPPAHAPLYTLAAAVAATRTCREAAVDAAIKWPNDVVVPGGDGDDEEEEEEKNEGVQPRDRKLAGVLTEMEGEADRVSWLVVGVGVNANVDADRLPEGATSLRAQVGDVDRRRFLQRFLESFAGLAAGLESVVPAWRELAATLGRPVRVETPGGPVEGDAVDVTDAGALVVRTADGERVVHAGDCEHLRPVEGG